MSGSTKQGRTYWLTLNSRLGQAQLALALSRFGDAATANKIVASIKERSVVNEEMGRFWREDELSFPERGSGVVLFISRDHQGRLSIVNGIQGLWPLGEDGKPMGMGTSYTIEELKKEIAETGQSKKLQSRGFYRKVGDSERCA